MKYVGSRYGQKAADEGVGRDGDQREDQPQRGVQSELRIEQLGPGDQARRDVEDNKENRDAALIARRTRVSSLSRRSRNSGSVSESSIEMV